jgi:hypothetical protein
MKKFQIKQKCEKMTKWREKFTGLRWMNWVECSLSCTFRQWKPPSQIILSSFWSMVLNKKTNEWLYFVLRKRCQVSCVERGQRFWCLLFDSVWKKKLLQTVHCCNLFYLKEKRIQFETERSTEALLFKSFCNLFNQTILFLNFSILIEWMFEFIDIEEKGYLWNLGVE